MVPMDVKRTLSISVETRWYTQYHCMKGLWEARQIIMAIAGDNVLMDGIAPQQRDKRDAFLETVRDPSLWDDIKVLIDYFNK